MIAVCIDCEHEPLVGTFAFRNKEYICLGCGRTYSFFGPPSSKLTEKLIAAQRERNIEWDKHGTNLMVDDFKKVNCESCRSDSRHQDHATSLEWHLHNEAVKWLTDRTGKDFTNLMVVPA